MAAGSCSPRCDVIAVGVRLQFVVAGVWLVQVALFMLSVLLLFWEIGWKPYASKADNSFSITLSGSQCIISGLEVYVVNAFLNHQVDNTKQVRESAATLILACA